MAACLFDSVFFSKRAKAPCSALQKKCGSRFGFLPYLLPRLLKTPPGFMDGVGVRISVTNK
nr:MAG TPA: NS2 peptide, GBVB, VIRAL PROTEIN [Caudoviricetes sp.]